MAEFEFDEIGYWSEVKLDIIKEYASAYSRILSAQTRPKLEHIYIDGFAGGGHHKAKVTGQFIAGSPANALSIRPPFHEYHFIDLNQQKVAALEELSRERSDVRVYRGDCNEILLKEVFPRAQFGAYRRALCILDPYGLQLDWRVIAEAGRMKSIEIFLNFPVADINRNVLWRQPDSVNEAQRRRLTAYWGDDSWRTTAYRDAPQQQLFGPPAEEKASNEVVAEAFRQRLHGVAGFANVPSPIAMRNSKNAIVYYLFFASQKPVAESIVRDIFKKYGNRDSEPRAR